MTDTVVDYPTERAVKTHEGTLARSAEIRNAAGLVSESEMAAILQVSEETLATWRCKKRGPPSIKLGKKVFYLIADFGKWVLGEVERQAAVPYIPRRNKPGAGRPRLTTPVHVDENQPGVHVNY